MRFGSLFSGIGGLDLGLEQAGLQCEYQIEIDKDCRRVLTNHWPGVERFEDVGTVGKLRSVDVICGGFPCQDLSVAGKRKGLAGERSGLWFEFLRVIECNRPRWVLIENVPGLLSSDEGRDFAAILRGLVDVGYCIAWRVLDAQYDGVAQRRRRVFIVGSFGDGSCAQILFESESVSWNPPTRREAGAGVAPTVRGGTASGSNEFGNKVTGAVSSKWAKGTGGPAGDGAYNLVIPIQEVSGRQSKNQNGIGIGIGLDSETMYTLQAGQVHGVAHTLRSEGADASEDGTGRGTPLVVNCFNGYTGGPDDNDAQGNHLIAFDHCLQGSDRTFIHRKNGQAQLQASRPDAVAGGFGVRRLTPRECERLQSFPDDWTRYDSAGKEISDSARYRMLGNAVCVNVARWIGKRILETKGANSG